MKELNEQELMDVDGGVALTTVVAVTAVVGAAYGAGYAVGKAYSHYKNTK